MRTARSAHDVMAALSVVADISLSDLYGRRKNRETVRLISAAYLAGKQLGLSTSALGLASRRDHSTVLSAMK
jgi:chromosomal replication initiation ATPase DnaA